VSAREREILEARVEQRREELADAIEDVRAGALARVDFAKSRLDLRRQVRRRPAAWLAGAWVVGFLMGVRR
jgi:hypothetical protein